MLGHILLATTVPGLPIMNETEVLPICPIHNQILFVLGARDAFLEQEGLRDIQDFIVRKDIEDMETTIGFKEIKHRDDMRQFFSGVGRLLSNLQEDIELFQKLKKSRNWKTEKARLGHFREELPDNNGLMWLLLGTYGRVSELYENGLYREAGSELAISFFPTKHMPFGNISWPMLPYEMVPVKGEQSSSLLAGLLYGFTKEERFDNLTACVTN